MKTNDGNGKQLKTGEFVPRIFTFLREYHYHQRRATGFSFDIIICIHFAHVRRKC